LDSIKFRVWDKITNYWALLDDLNTRKPFHFTPDSFSLFHNEERFIFNMYTNIYNIGGQKIFADDLIEFEDYVGTYRVIWGWDAWALKNISDGEPFDSGDYYHGYEIPWEKGIIVGNFHEGLLKEETK